MKKNNNRVRKGAQEMIKRESIVDVPWSHKNVQYGNVCAV